MNRVHPQITLCGKFDRERAIKWIGQAPAGTRVTFRDAKRTNDQCNIPPQESARVSRAFL